MAIQVHEACNPVFVTAGLVEGVSQVNKFGANDATVATPATIWPGAEIAGAELYTPSTVADIRYLIFESLSDSGQNIQIQGLDENGLEVDAYADSIGTRVIDIGALNAQKATNRVRIINGPTNQGRIFFCTSDQHTLGIPDDKASIRAIIPTGLSQTHQVHYTVPSNKYAAVYGGYVAINSPLPSKTASCSWRITRNGSPPLNVGKIALSTNYRPNWQESYPCPAYLEPNSRVWVQIDSVDSSTTGMISRFYLALKEI